MHSVLLYIIVTIVRLTVCVPHTGKFLESQNSHQITFCTAKEQRIIVTRQ